MSVTSEDEAQQTVNQTDSKVVIWGWYDDLGIQVRLFLSGGQESGSVMPGTEVIRLLPGAGPSSEISVIITEILPQNVSFLSLFVIGHLAYLSNNYQTGQRAFDAAMAQIPPPEKVTIQNRAILHFFRARHLDRSGADLESVVCEYAKAIALDPGFDVAYNNLGLVISRLYGDIKPRIGEFVTPMPATASACKRQGSPRTFMKTLPIFLDAPFLPIQT